MLRVSRGSSRSSRQGPLITVGAGGWGALDAEESDMVLATATPAAGSPATGSSSAAAGAAAAAGAGTVAARRRGRHRRLRRAEVAWPLALAAVMVVVMVLAGRATRGLRLRRRGHGALLRVLRHGRAQLVLGRLRREELVRVVRRLGALPGEAAERHAAEYYRQGPHADELRIVLLLGEDLWREVRVRADNAWNLSVVIIGDARHTFGEDLGLLERVLEDMRAAKVYDF